MKPSFLLPTLALALAFAAPSSYAAPPADPAPAEVVVGTAPAVTEQLTDAQRFGRFFKGAARSAGAGLKKTGQAMGRMTNKMIEKGGPKPKSTPAP